MNTITFNISIVFLSKLIPNLSDYFTKVDILLCNKSYQLIDYSVCIENSSLSSSYVVRNYPCWLFRNIKTEVFEIHLVRKTSINIEN